MIAQDVVFTFFHENWPDAVRRRFMPPDRLVQTLLTHDRVRRLLVVNPYRSGPILMARKLMRREPDPPFPTGPEARLITPLRLRRRDPVGSERLTRTYAALDRRIRAEARDMGLEKPAIVTTNPFYAAFAPLDWAGPVTYYAWDDWAALSALGRWQADFEEAYRRIARRNVRVCTISETLLRLIAPTARGIVVPNGIIESEWQPPWREQPWFQALPSPRILYVGAIHERLDTDALKEVSEHFPNGSITVVGPIANSSVVEVLRALPNIHLHAPLPHAEIAGLMHHADVCIMPHHRNALTESMSPLKVYEYCATGRPVVATALSPVRNVDPRVHLVEPGGSYAQAVETALKDPPISEADRQAFLARNSWRGRHEEIMELALN